MTESDQSPAPSPTVVVAPRPPHRELRKVNTEIGYRVQSGHLSLLSRKLVNILLYYAQHMRGQEDASGKYWVEGPRIIKDAKFNSRDYDLLRDSLDELQSVRILRPTESGGISSDVLIPSFTLENAAHPTNEAVERGQKRRGGRLMIGFSLPQDIKELLLNPRNNYTVLPIQYVANLRTIGGLVLYEICKRYATNPSKLTNRESWQWWWRILTGAPADADPPEYKYFKRDTIKKGIDEINSVTDLEIELLEYKEGRWVKELQFSITIKTQGDLDLSPAPIDASLLARITGLGVSTPDAEKLIQRYAEADLTSNLELLEARLANTALPKLGSPAAYLKAALRDNYGAGAKAAKTAKAAKVAKQDQDAALREEEHAAQALAAEQQREARRARFVALPEAEQDELISDFATSLIGPAAASFRKTGLKTKLVSATFDAWLTKHFGDR